jgi:transglutaminase-like putative cysteine protease
MDRFDGREWRHVREATVDVSGVWNRASRRRWRRPGHEPGPRIVVSLEDPAATRLFAPLSSQSLDLDPPANPDLVEPTPDLTILYPRGARGRGRIRYSLVLSSERPTPGGPTLHGRQVEHTLVLQKPGTVPRSARRLARAIAESLPEDAAQHEIVERMRRHLSTRHEYLPPGAEDGARNLDDFVTGRAGGHCEYFATALAVMLRCEGIPCRLVTGYRSEEWDEAGEVLTVRARHAHAWVEVLDPEAGWMTLDPSPVLAEGLGRAGEGLFSRIGLFAAGLWDKVTSFDSDARLRAFAWLKALPARTFAAAKDRPLLSVMIVALIVVFVTLRRGRRIRRPAAVRSYLGQARRAGVRTRPGETPREMLLRARRLALHPAKLDRLEAATVAHERLRYGPAAR